MPGHFFNSVLQFSLRRIVLFPDLSADTAENEFLLIGSSASIIARTEQTSMHGKISWIGGAALRHSWNYHRMIT